MNSRNEAAKETQKEARRWQILLAGLKIFARKGFAATGMKEIAQTAGVSYGLAYHYFASKDELYSCLIEIALETSIRLYQKAAASEEGPEVKLRFIVEEVLKATDDEISPLFFLLMIQASTMAGLPDAVHELFSRRLGEYDRVLLSIVEEGQRLGLVRPGDPKTHLVYLSAIFQGMAIERAIDPRIPLPSAEGILRGILI